MSDLTALEAAHALAGPVGDLGGRWLLDRGVINEAKPNGYPNGFVYYFRGRGGVLGDVDASVVGAAFGFFEPGLLRAMWEQGLAVEDGRTASRRYGAACAQWAREHLAAAAGLDRIAELGERVVDSVDVGGLSLFAGWAAEPRPGDAVGKAGLMLHILRELRGSVHIVATTATGLAPRETILAWPAQGVERAKLFGWPEPYEEISDEVAARRQRAEDLTDELMAAILDRALSGAERAELVSTVRTARDAVV